MQREQARRAKGSANRGKARRKVAALHGKIARARLDHHHKQALRLVRDNQAVNVEDLNIVGMVRNRRLARAISDAGWAQFVRLIEEKAERHGRTVVKVSRWLPSSKTCSGCGYVRDSMPLNIRVWTCPGCATKHDRDHNAAINILAAGRAERLNACGAQVGPSLQRAQGDETGSIRRGIAASESPAFTSDRGARQVTVNPPNGGQLSQVVHRITSHHGSHAHDEVRTPQA